MFWLFRLGNYVHSSMVWKPLAYVGKLWGGFTIAHALVVCACALSHWFAFPLLVCGSCQCTKQRMRLTLLLSLKLGGWVQLGETMSAISHMHFSIFSFKTNSPWNSGRTRPREWPHRWVHCLRPCLARVCCTVLFSLLEEGGIARRDWAEDFQPYFYRSTVDTQIALG